MKKRTRSESEIPANFLPDVVEMRYWEGRQSAHLRILKRLPHRNGHTLARVEVKRDSYEEQSYARAEVWCPTALRWNPVADIPHPLMAATDVPVSAEYRVLRTALNQDAETLLSLTETVLEFVPTSKVSLKEVNTPE